MQHMGKIKIGLFGFGVVGQGIYEVVRKSKNANAEIVKICVRPSFRATRQCWRTTCPK